ncbi:MAG: DNA repair protein RecN [Nitrospirae bacterium]|nr:DNA repair protein RecN [Nitrospirota bacterium]
MSMLKELHIKNLAIIDDITIEFGDRLTVLTGETGAGKSIIIDALCLALGERASGEIIRSGEKEALVEAFFDIPPKNLNQKSRQTLADAGTSADDGLIMKRIVSAQGKNRAYINDSMTGVQTLSDISRNLIDVHGQYEHQSLLSSDNQLDLLDAYGGLVSEREGLASVYQSLVSANRNIAELIEKEKERAQRIDMLQFQTSEIKTANLKTGEEEGLVEESGILSNVSRLMELAHGAYESIYSSEAACLTNLFRTINAFKEIANIDNKAQDAAKSLQDAAPLLEEAAHFLRDYKERLNFDPERLAVIQERLEFIKGLKKKYRGDIESILAYKVKAEEELAGMQNAEERLELLKDEREGLKKELTEKAGVLSQKRKAVAKKIETAVVKELAELSMPDTKFSINMTAELGDDTLDGFKAHPKGIDKIDYLISTNVGEELRPLSKVASGGELSRIMLALKGILSGGDKIPVLIFDEIDAGIGGRAAETVGQKLKNLSKKHQVICITHLPQIASYGDSHLRIEKKVKGQRTVVEVKALEKEERTIEIARMLSGNVTDASVKHAKEMLKLKGFKESEVEAT